MNKLILICLLIFSILAHANGKKMTVKIEGMTCPSCAASVESQFKKLDAVDSIDISIGKGIATITLKSEKDLKENVVKKAVKDAGFRAVSIQTEK